MTQMHVKYMQTNAHRHTHPCDNMHGAVSSTNGLSSPVFQQPRRVRALPVVREVKIPG